MASKFFVVLLADKGIPGHAFVSLGRESDELESSVTDGTWGMYPQNSVSGIESVIIGEVPGVIKDDYFRNKDYSLVVEVSKGKYEVAKTVLEKWRSKDYELLKSDCLSFVIEIANVLKDEITVIPRTGFDNLPAEYLKKLILENK